MKRNKKLIISAVIVAVALIGGLIGGLAYATDENNTNTDTTATDTLTKREQMMNRIAEIYEENTGVALDWDQLQAAFTQAREEQQLAALQEKLQAMVTAGTITQEQADAYLNWWEAKPDIPALEGFGGPMGGGRRGAGPMGGMYGPCR